MPKSDRCSQGPNSSKYSASSNTAVLQVQIGFLNNPSPANTLHIPTLPSYNCQLSGSLLHCKNLQQPESWSYKNEHLSLERRRRTRELDLVLLLEDLRLSCWM